MNCCKEPKFFPLWDRLSGCLPLILGALALLLLSTMCASRVPQFTLGSPNTMTLEGIAGANECIEIYEGDRKIGDAQTAADGKFTFKLPAGLAAGAHTFSGKVTCGPGLRLGSVALAPLTLTVPSAATPAPTAAAPAPTAVPPTVVPPTAVPTVAPTVAPTAAPTVAPTAAPATAPTTIDAVGAAGLVAGGQITGKAEKNCELTIFNGSTELGKATADATGIWKFVLPATLKAGDYSLKAACAKSESSVLSVKVSEPTPAVATTIDPVTGNAIVFGGKLTGKSAKDCDVAILDGSTEIGKAKSDTAGVWSFTLPTTLSAGEHSFKAICKPSESAAAVLRVVALLPVTGDSE